eukprot:Unigene12540_Nuclearia_a/m.38086 Unigene12540_Nuclearia_a/g.38086  ORF Unigene12540_Nuclearia_a/g.38086 Unigene12540_Nuclearia_a/m.38086 type:complete len:336 (+) Unigene12540_Nuclearia_a:38-1045(+)
MCHWGSGAAPVRRMRVCSVCSSVSSRALRRSIPRRSSSSIVVSCAFCTCSTALRLRSASSSSRSSSALSGTSGRVSVGASSGCRSRWLSCRSTCSSFNRIDRSTWYWNAIERSCCTSSSSVDSSRGQTIRGYPRSSSVGEGVGTGGGMIGSPAGFCRLVIVPGCSPAALASAAGAPTKPPEAVDSIAAGRRGETTTSPASVPLTCGGDSAGSSSAASSAVFPSSPPSSSSSPSPSCEPPRPFAPPAAADRPRFLRFFLAAFVVGPALPAVPLFSNAADTPLVRSDGGTRLYSMSSSVLDRISVPPIAPGEYTLHASSARPSISFSACTIAALVRS